MDRHLADGGTTLRCIEAHTQDSKQDELSQSNDPRVAPPLPTNMEDSHRAFGGDISEDIWSTEDREQLQSLERTLWDRYSETKDCHDLRSAEDISTLIDTSALDQLSPTMQKLTVNSIILLQRFKHLKDRSDFDAVVLLLTLAMRLIQDRPSDAPVWLHAFKILQDMRFTLAQTPNSTNQKECSAAGEQSDGQTSGCRLNQIPLSAFILEESCKSLLSLLICCARAGPSKVDEHTMKNVLEPILAEVEESDDDSDSDGCHDSDVNIELFWSQGNHTPLATPGHIRQAKCEDPGAVDSEAEAQLGADTTSKGCQSTLDLPADSDAASSEQNKRGGSRNDLVQKDTSTQRPPKTRYEQQGDGALLRMLSGAYIHRPESFSDDNAAILAHEHDVKLIPDGHPRKPERLFHLANSQDARYRRLGMLEDLDSVITTYSHAIMLIPDEDAMKPWMLVLRGDARKARFERLKDLGDLDGAITDYTQAIGHIPIDIPETLTAWSSLASSYQIRSAVRGETIDADAAIRCYTQTIKLAPNSYVHRPSLIAGLGLAYMTRYDQCRSLDDIQAAIRWFSDAIQVASRAYPDKPAMWRDLGSACEKRFERLDAADDLDTAIDAYTQAIELMSDDSRLKHELYSSLGSARKTRFEHFNTPDDLDAAIAALKHAVKLAPDDQPIKAALLSNLGSVQQLRFDRLGNIPDLQAAVTSHRQALERTAEDCPDKHFRLGNASVSFKARFDRLGSLEDLEAAIEAASTAVKLSPDRHEAKPMWLTDLGSSLSIRFERLSNSQDLDQSIVHFQDALSLVPNPHPERHTFLTNLAMALRSRFLWYGTGNDLVDAARYLRQAAPLCPDNHPDKPMMLSNLGLVLAAQFNLSRTTDDLDSAIAAHSQAVELSPQGHYEKPKYLNNLSLAQIKRFEHLCQCEDIEAAIRNGTQAASLTPERHPVKVRRWGNAARAIFAKCCSPFGTEADFEDAFRAFKFAFKENAGYPPEMLDAAIKLGDFISRYMYHEEGEIVGFLLHVHQRVLDLLPQVVWLGHDISRRYRELMHFGTLSNKAAAAAVAAGACKRAIEWLESGRSIVWAQVLRLRSPLDTLQQHHPELASQLEQVFRTLQSISSADNEPTGLSLPRTESSLELQTKSQYGAAIKYDKLLERIRNLEGFENFLRSRSISQLTPAYSSGYVVLINAHQSRCDALLLHPPNHVTHVPLPSVSFTRAEKWQKQLRDVLKARKARHGVGRFRDDEKHIERGGERLPNPDATMRRVLSELWNDVVKPVLDQLKKVVAATSRDDNRLPHITWCPTGPLVFLPLHAAGIYTKNASSDTLMDHAVSSYTPTLELLLRSRTSFKRPTDTATSNTSSFKPRILIVAKSTDTEGRNAIPNTKEEAKIIQDTLSSSTDITVLNEEQATVNQVLENMETHDWIHLACHGIQDVRDPMQSGFALHDDRLTLSKLMNKALPKADLAVLSACQTATGEKKLSEEAVHLAAAMLNAGFKSVIGTMWSISDGVAPRVARIFYKVLREQVDAGEELQPAYALQEVIQQLRRTDDLLRWVPFVHFGL